MTAAPIEDIDLERLFSEGNPQCEATDRITGKQCPKEADVQIAYTCSCPQELECWLCNPHFVVVQSIPTQCTSCHGNIIAWRIIR